MSTTSASKRRSRKIQLILVSCPPEHAAALARTLVEARVAACVSIVPGVRSIYRWQDAVEDQAESLLLIKAPVDGFAALKAAILAHHAYELPEILAVNVDQGHAAYLEWVISSCGV